MSLSTRAQEPCWKLCTLVNRDGGTHFWIFGSYYVSTTTSNSCATKYLEHSRTSTTSNLSDWSTIVYIVHQVQNIWGARAQDQPLTSHESQPSELQGGWTVHTGLCALRICVFHILYFRYILQVCIWSWVGLCLLLICISRASEVGECIWKATRGLGVQFLSDPGPIIVYPCQ